MDLDLYSFRLSPGYCCGFLFTDQDLTEDQSLVIKFLIPKAFVLNADVLFSKIYNMSSRVISPNRLGYRVGLKFTFLKPGERTLLRQFLESIHPEVPEEQEAKGGGEEEDEDEFGELGDF